MDAGIEDSRRLVENRRISRVSQSRRGDGKVHRETHESIEAQTAAYLASGGEVREFGNLLGAKDYAYNCTIPRKQ